jgi:FkbM family methyltransferase
MSRTISYAQRFEDLYLLRCFGDRDDGFYVDVGSGHPVYDNVSFAFYLRGWRGITVEPNPHLSRLARAVRPRDYHVEALVGAAEGEATFHLVEDYHGLSTMIAEHARAAHAQFGKASRALTVPVTTLAALCGEHAPPAFAFLKVDVEGAEHEVLIGGDWRRFRPEIVVVEALAPYSLEPAWERFEPLLAANGYRPVAFDSLNRYYLAAEAERLAPCFAAAPPTAAQFRNVGPALADAGHPDHRLAVLLAGAAMTRLPLLPADLVCDLLTAGIPEPALDTPAGPAEIAAAIERLFGPGAALAAAHLLLPPQPQLRDVYAAIVASDEFRAACGRISASYAW